MDLYASTLLQQPVERHRDAHEVFGDGAFDMGAFMGERFLIVAWRYPYAEFRHASAGDWCDRKRAD
ncbi:hypothetical protein FGG78_19175 [Thioclava sp. BHET1]|nr:hypothetical protein FGG78_19175 [Thioclava sp. BHET1]